MNWYHRGEERYVEYGSSFPATRAFGVVRSLYDTVYNMNMAHLTRARKTVFEHLDDAGFRTACTTYLIYRGRTRHEPSGASVYRRIAEALGASLGQVGVIAAVLGVAWIAGIVWAVRMERKSRALAQQEGALAGV